MNNSTKIAKESFISFFGMGMGHFFRYLFTTFLGRWVGIELLGIYSISNAVTRIFEVFGKLGLDQGLLREINRKEKTSSKQQVILSALKMASLSGLIFMLIEISIASWLSESIFHGSTLLKKVLVVHALSIPFFIIMHISESATQSYKLLKYKIFVSEIQNPLILLIVMFLCYFFYTSESAIIFPVIISAILGFLSINVFLKKISGVNIKLIQQGKFDIKILSYSIPIMFMAILSTVLHWTDIIMLGYFKGVETVGIYHPAVRTAGIIRIILVSFTGIYGPILAELYFKKQTDKMKHIYKLVTRWIITFSLPITILIIIYPKKIMLIFGENFIVGYPILMILAIAAFIQSIFGVGGTTLVMSGFPKINLFNTFFACFINIGINIILIPKMGGVGAALATLITLCLIAVIRCFQNWKLLDLNPISKLLFKPIIAGSITLVIGNYLKGFILSYHTIYTLFLAGLIIFIIYFSILWIIGFDEDDKSLINGIQIIITRFSRNIKYK